MNVTKRPNPWWALLALLWTGCAATATSGEARGVVGEEVAYAVDGVEMKGYLAYDSGLEGPRPGVLVVHEWWGHNDYARERARMLAELGYTAFALDMYGGGKQAGHPQDAQAFMLEVISDMDGAVARFQEAQRLLEEHATTDPERTAAIGYCFGGAVVLHMARAGLELDGVASFHGSLGTESPAAPGRTRAKVLVLTGGSDPMIPEEQVKAFETEMKAAGVDYELVVYSDAVHAFTNPGATALGEEFGLPLAYDADADRKSWAELKAFLAELFGG